LLDESISYYDWLYDPKYGRNLSVGMLAGYLLAEDFETKEVLPQWDAHPKACRRLLDDHGRKIAEIIEQRIAGNLDPKVFENAGHIGRYYRQLVEKAEVHREGPKAWLEAYGDLGKEFDRYRNALADDYAADPKNTFLKPIWAQQTFNVSGGVH